MDYIAKAAAEGRKDRAGHGAIDASGAKKLQRRPGGGDPTEEEDQPDSVARHPSRKRIILGPGPPSRRSGTGAKKQHLELTRLKTRPCDGPRVGCATLN